MFTHRTAAHRLRNMDLDELAEVAMLVGEVIDQYVDWEQVDDHDAIVRLADLGIVRDGRRRTHQFLVKVTVEVEVDITTTLHERDAREQAEAIAADLMTLAADAIERAPDTWDIDGDEDAEVDITIGRTDHRTD